MNFHQNRCFPGESTHFKISDKLLNWTEAIDYCNQTQCSSLARIRSQMDRTELQKVIDDSKEKIPFFWMSLRQTTDFVLCDVVKTMNEAIEFLKWHPSKDRFSYFKLKVGLGPMSCSSTCFVVFVENLSRQLFIAESPCSNQRKLCMVQRGKRAIHS